jgi:anti-sigma regulatory factor (Ser/Thr protein kinase)
MQVVTHVTDTFARSYEAEPSAVARARTELADFASEAGASAALVDGVRLAVSEAVTNAVRHAYPRTGGEVRVLARAGEDELEVIVDDDGCGVRSDSDDHGLGFGLALMCEMSDEMTLAPRADGGTEVRMRFGLGAADSGAALGRL